MYIVKATDAQDYTLWLVVPSATGGAPKLERAWPYDVHSKVEILEILGMFTGSL